MLEAAKSITGSWERLKAAETIQSEMRHERKQELMVRAQNETSEGQSSNPMHDLDLLCDLGQVVSPV